MNTCLLLKKKAETNKQKISSHMKFFTHATKWFTDKEGACVCVWVSICELRRVCACVCVSMYVLSCNAIFPHWEISFQTVLSGCVHHFIRALYRAHNSSLVGLVVWACHIRMLLGNDKYDSGPTVYTTYGQSVFSICVSTFDAACVTQLSKCCLFETGSPVT